MASTNPAPSGDGDKNGLPATTTREGSDANIADANINNNNKSNTSEVEQLAYRIEERRDARIPVTFQVRVRFLKTCQSMAASQGLTVKISKTSLLNFRENVAEKVPPNNKWYEWLGFRNTSRVLSQVLDKAVERVEMLDSDWLYYQDFSFYFTKLESRWPWMRNPVYVTALNIFAFYLFTPIFFCAIVNDRDVCPRDPDKSYAGWLTSLYFASTTMSTVGYGDVSVDKSARWRVFMGILYMVISMIVLVTAFATAVDQAFSPLTNLHERLVEWCSGDLFKGKYLHQRLRRVMWVKVSVIVLQFNFINLLGMFVARAFVNQQWTWMYTFYWSVQTTTTIGYGDLDMPFDMRWFQILYLLISTYFVGDALGKIGSLRTELQEIRRRNAWERREVTKGMIEDMQAETNKEKDKVDQYEFVVASLLQLQKVTSEDIGPIMLRYRQLANPITGEISIHNVEEQEEKKNEEGEEEVAA